MLSQLTKTLCAVFIVVSGAQAEEKARWANSAYSAEILFRVVDRYTAPQWYIGTCPGDISPLYGRTKIYQVHRSGSDIVDVRLTSDKRRADRVLCIKAHDETRNFN